MRRRVRSRAVGGRPSTLLQSEVQRAVVRMGATLGVAMALINMVAAGVVGDALFALVGAETALVTLVAGIQLWRRRPNLPVLMVLTVVLAALTLHAMPDAHRVAIGMAMASIAGLASVFVGVTHRWRFHFVMTAAWLLQLAFAGSRDLSVAYQLSSYVVLATGLGMMQRSLAETRGRYQGLFEHAPVALWEEDFSAVAAWLDELRAEGVADLRGYFADNPEEVDRALSLVDVVGVNPAAADLIEVDDPSGLVGRIDPTTFKPETRPSFIEQVYAVWAGASDAVTDLTGATVTGRPIEAVLRWAAPPGPDGKPDYRRVVVSISDVSTLKTIQRELEDRERQLRTVVSGAPIVLFAIDADGVFTMSEGTGLELLGLRPGEVVGTSAFTLYADDPEISANLRRALTGDAFTAVVDRGHLVWEVRHQPVYDDSGQIEGVIGVSTDATERHRMERALEKAEQRYRLVVQHASDLLFTVDRGGRIAFASPSFEPVLGYRPEEVTGVGMENLVHPDDLADAVLSANATGPGESSLSVEVRVRRSDGSWCQLEARAANLLDDPDLRCWVVTGRDITDRVEARRQLEAAKDAAESATRAKSELLANVSHEIRTPMNAILGMTDLALGTEVDDEQRDYLLTVRSSAQALLTIINDLLDLAKVEAGRLEIETVPFALRSTLEDVMRAMRVRAAQKGIDLLADLEDGVPNWVSGDPGRLRQVLINLIGNAVKFTDVGSVRVTATPTGEDLVRFEVADTGIGIAEEDLADVFGAFEQADSSSTRRHGGTGLGLAISAKLVDLMGGQIQAESSVGRGSSFSFTAHLPAAAPIPAGSSRGASPHGPVLIVADGKVRRRLVEMVADAGYAALGVGSLAEVVAVAGSLAAEGQQVGAMVVDFVEPDVGFCRRLAAQNAVAGVPMMAIVGAGRRGDGARFRAAGVRSYLTRPMDETDLREALRAITSGEASAEVLVTKHWLREKRRPLRILVADDSATNRLLATRLLERRGHLISGVASGREAITACSDSAFDVVLMDVQMPEIDGLEATRAIRRREQEFGGHLPIVALTAHAMASDRQACLEAGMDDYLAKPFGADELIEVVERTSRHRPERAPSAMPPRRSLQGDVAAAFLDEYPSLVDAIDESMEEGRLWEVRAQADRLAEGLHAVGAGGAAETAGRLGRAAGRSDWDDATQAYAGLTEALEGLEPELASLAGQYRG